MGAPQRLLERESEIAAVEEALTAAAAGAGAVLLVEGPAGIGKTSLLDSARERAASLGMTVMSARGAELEREIAHGVVRQLLELPVRTASAPERAAMLEGAAGLAEPVVLMTAGVAQTDAGAPARDQPSAVVHGLYWLTAYSPLVPRSCSSWTTCNGPTLRPSVICCTSRGGSRVFRSSSLLRSGAASAPRSRPPSWSSRCSRTCSSRDH